MNKTWRHQMKPPCLARRDPLTVAAGLNAKARPLVP
jgi:hypothetical protein